MHIKMCLKTRALNFEMMFRYVCWFVIQVHFYQHPHKLNLSICRVIQVVVLKVQVVKCICLRSEISQTYCQTCKMERFAKIVKSFQPSFISAPSFMFDRVLNMLLHIVDDNASGKQIFIGGNWYLGMHAFLLLSSNCVSISIQLCLEQFSEIQVSRSIYKQLFKFI